MDVLDQHNALLLRGSNCSGLRRADEDRNDADAVAMLGTMKRLSLKEHFDAQRVQKVREGVDGGHGNAKHGHVALKHNIDHDKIF